jgi:transcriptional regulator with XRE-family HTH domain
MNFGTRLKKLRTDNNLTQLQLAEILGTSKSNISKYEAGSVEPNLETLVKISKEFGESIDNLLDTSKQECVDNTIGKTISSFRELKGLSQSQLADLLGVSQCTVEYYESGERIPSINILKKLSGIFGLSIDELVGVKKMNSNGNCDNFLYEEGLANWNIRRKSEELGLSYEEVLDRTDIARERFDLLWFGNYQPYAEELLRFSEVLDTSIDYLLDNSKRERLTANEEIILRYYNQLPNEVMDLLSSFCSLGKKNRTIVSGKCFELEQDSSVAADESEPKTGTHNQAK